MMKTKKTYHRPAMNIVATESEELMAGTGSINIPVSSKPATEEASSKGRVSLSPWDEE